MLEDQKKRLNQYVSQYLNPIGWLRSIELEQAVDLEGPVPWYTYPMLRVLPKLVCSHFNVFEFGSGNSSLWWAAHVEEVVSVDHDSEWFEQVQARASHSVVHQPMDSNKNESLYNHLMPFFELGLKERLTDDPAKNIRAGVVNRPFKSYAAELLHYPPGYFDVIVVDGMARVLTAWLASRLVKPDGFILFDNSDRDFYDDAYALLKQAEFKRIDFWGTGPLNPYEWCTSIFTKNLEIFA